MQKHIFILIVVISVVFSIEIVSAQELNRNEIYKNSIRPDIPRDIQEIPYEDSDYKSKHYSPYVLVKIPQPCRNGKEFLSSGIYLAKIFKENSVTYILFKKESKIAALIPTIETSTHKKKEKKMYYNLIETDHGKTYYLTIKYLYDSYTIRLTIEQS